MNVPSLWAVVPVKSFSSAKLRLAAMLSADERRALARAMFEDVLEVLVQSPFIAGVLVVTADPQAAAIARDAGASVLNDPPEGGLNASVRAAARVLGDAQHGGMLVVPADLPQITPADIELISLGHRRSPAVTLIAASSDGGTNALACSPPSALPISFGEDSFRRHHEAAQALGLAPRVLTLPRFARDIDRPDDLIAFLDQPSATRTHACLKAGASRRRVVRSRPVASRRHHSLRRDQTLMIKPLIASSQRLSAHDAYGLLELGLDVLMPAAAARRDAAHGGVVSYSRKVFIPLTQLCRDVCHYCTFAHSPRNGEAPYLAIEKVLAIARAGAAAGCKEALFTLGDKPELRYHAARQALDEMGFATTLDYLAEVARVVYAETGLLPHVNPGLLDINELRQLREVSISQGIMLESSSERLCERGGPHFGSPDKKPAARLETIRLAGEAGVPFTTGILIGIGETRRERIDALLSLRELHERHGHIQEIIVQNFRPKVGTLMVNAPIPSLEEHLWTIAAARLIFDPAMNIQAPPNLSPGALRPLVDAGINDWGGVSPVTPDHVNPEAPWPHLDALAKATRNAGKELTERLALYPAYARELDRWVDPAFRTPMLHRVDSDGLPRTDNWSPGGNENPPQVDVRRIETKSAGAIGAEVERILARAKDGQTLDEAEIVRLFRARGAEFTAVCAAADELRRKMNGDEVSFVVNRNINYTNICAYRCQFCAFAKGKATEDLRGKPYDLPIDEIQRRVREAWDRGATEVCMQGGIHPSYTGATYLEICRAVKQEAPQMHVHAFSPLEIWQGAKTLGLPLRDYLLQLKDAGLSTLPGTAAEILDDEVRQVICQDKVTTQQWLEVMRVAHGVGLRSTSTIMFGHMERLEHWARHLLHLRTLQIETGGITEFVPLPFVHMESPIYRKGRARRGPSFREAVLMHAVGRLALHPVIPNIQASWVKLGTEGVKACLNAGVNDLGGTLMNETISRAAGASHGQEMTAMDMEAMLRAMGRNPRQRTTLYTAPPADAQARARNVTTPVEPVRIELRRKHQPAAAAAATGDCPA